MTGASGTRYGRRLLQVLTEQGVTVELVLSVGARRVLELEESIRLGDPLDPAGLVEDLGGLGAAPVKVHDPDDISASIASGSTPVDGMVIVGFQVFRRDTERALEVLRDLGLSVSDH